MRRKHPQAHQTVFNILLFLQHLFPVVIFTFNLSEIEFLDSQLKGNILP